jgi:glutathione S-transferase
MDSLAIAKALEKLHPNPSLHLDSPLLDKVTTLIFQIRTALVPIFMPLVPKLLLPERSAEYFRKTREQRTGRKLEEIYEDKETGGAKAWEKARNSGLQELGSLYKKAKEDNGGPFLEGKEPGFGDFVVAGQMRMFERLGHLANYVRGSGEEVAEMYEACRPWLQRDSY